MFKYIPDRFKALLIASICVNFAALYFGVKHVYYKTGKKNTVFSEKPTLNNLSYYLNRQTVYDIFPVTQNDIVFAGDSHTQRFDVAEYFPGYNIKDRGIDKDISLGLLKRVDQITHGHPKKIFIEIGFNDLWFNFTADTIINHIKTIIDTIKIKSPGSEIYVNSIFPCSNNDGSIDFRVLVPILNTKLKRLCNSYDIPYIDINSKLNDNKDGLNHKYDAGDGIHLNGLGYLVWASLLKPYL